MRLIKLLLPICFSLLSFNAYGQEQGVKEELIGNDDQFAVSFHQPVLDDRGNLVVERAGKTIQVGKALTQEQISAGFKVGERIVIRVKPPIDCFVYVVNNSKWDGSTLVTNGREIKANEEQDFIYRLTNEQANQSAGAEELLFLFRRKAFNTKDVEDFLITQGKDKAPKIKLEKTGETDKLTTQLGEKQKKSKGVVVVSVACKIASIFFPWAGRVCTATGFAAVTPEPLPGEQIGLKPDQNAENLLVQFSFPVNP